MKFVSQKGQDRWLIEEVLGPLRGGYFLDLAAHDGVELSNTLVLERELGWSGLAIEANPTSFAKLQQNRNCICVEACIDESPGEVSFIPTAELGGIISTDTDNSPLIRPELLREWEDHVLRMRTRTLQDVLDEVKAPALIDYFSFDVEGAETRILRRFPFGKYRFRALTIERPSAELNQLLFSNGYVFVRNQQFDTFYVDGSMADRVPRTAFEQAPPKTW